VYYTSIASTNTPHDFKTCLSRRPTFRPSASWPQPETSVGWCCHRAKVTVGACGHVSCRYSCLFRRKNRENHGIICVVLSVLTCLPLIKIFCILLSKLRGRLFTIFTAFSCAYLWQFSTIDVLAIDCTGVVVPAVASVHSVWSV